MGSQVEPVRWRYATVTIASTAFVKSEGEKESEALRVLSSFGSAGFELVSATEFHLPVGGLLPPYEKVGMLLIFKAPDPGLPITADPDFHGRKGN